MVDALREISRWSRQRLVSRNAPLLYVQKAGGWRSASVLLRVYSRWVPEDITPVAGQPSATQPQLEAVSAARR